MPAIFSQPDLTYYAPLEDITVRTPTMPPSSPTSCPSEVILSSSVRMESGEIWWVISIFQVSHKSEGSVKGMRTRGLLHSDKAGVTALGEWADEAKEALENGKFELDVGAKMTFSILPLSGRRFKFEPLRNTHTGAKDLLEMTSRLAGCRYNLSSSERSNGGDDGWTKHDRAPRHANGNGSGSKAETARKCTAEFSPEVGGSDKHGPRSDTNPDPNIKTRSKPKAKSRNRSSTSCPVANNSQQPHPNGNINGHGPAHGGFHVKGNCQAEGGSATDCRNPALSHTTQHPDLSSDPAPTRTDTLRTSSNSQTKTKPKKPKRPKKKSTTPVSPATPSSVLSPAPDSTSRSPTIDLDPTISLEDQLEDLISGKEGDEIGETPTPCEPADQPDEKDTGRNDTGSGRMMFTFVSEAIMADLMGLDELD